MGIRILYIFLVAGLVAMSIFLYTCHKDYCKEYNDVKSEFKKIEGIKIIEIDGNSDLTLEDIYATVELKNGHTLGFCSLTESSFKSPTLIILSQLDHWRFYNKGYYNSTGDDWAGSSLDLGERSEYTEIRNLHLKNIKDVIDRFDDLNDVVDKIAVYPYFDTLENRYTSYYNQKYDVSIRDIRGW